MGMPKTRMYLEIFRMASLMSFPLLIYVIANENGIYEKVLDEKLRSARSAAKQDNEVEVTGNNVPGFNYLMGVCGKISKFMGKAE